jgi:hypothetical protein
VTAVWLSETPRVQLRRDGIFENMEDRARLRAADSDREAVAERLRNALAEGRLDFYEYDERLQQAYAAKTYAELDSLLADLPAPPGEAELAVAERQNVVATPPASTGEGVTRRWLLHTWEGYLTTVAITVGIWAVISVMSGSWHYFWPGWVAGPWGVVLAAITVSGLARGEPKRWAEKQARKEQAERAGQKPAENEA